MRPTASAAVCVCDHKTMGGPVAVTFHYIDTLSINHDSLTPPRVGNFFLLPNFECRKKRKKEKVPLKGQLISRFSSRHKGDGGIEDGGGGT